MTTRRLTFLSIGSTPATLILPEPLTLAALEELEENLVNSVAMLRCELGGAAADAGRREYESWMQHLRPG